ncbi:uncharacterized protein LOC130813375 [Amaranthus tricolor]|uniref:uncharacterized protein LOC130813375 n=1 Tax=Amaranthus tricolor TaxID=29722 RepID=UPI00258D6EC8|nr:uncharacterized protein LOC130813375 [Amaranthus tricolor]
MQETELVSIPKSLDLSCREYSATLEDLLQAIYPNIPTQSIHPSFFAKRAILTPQNEDVDLINSRLIDKFFGDVCINKSFDSLFCCVTLIHQAAYVMELDLFAKKFMPNVIQCEISIGFSKGECVMLPRINLRPSESSGYPFQFQRLQFPIKLCFAMTINKSQGQTLLDIGVYIRQPCFSHGQLYVALSRARKANNIKVLDESSIEQKATSPCVANVVSHALLK